MRGIFPPITVNGRRYLDGGMLSGTTTHLAAGHDKVLVISLVAGFSGIPGMQRFAQAATTEETSIIDGTPAER